jgi:hypothetical protein
MLGVAQALVAELGGMGLPVYRLQANWRRGSAISCLWTLSNP